MAATEQDGRGRPSDLERLPESSGGSLPEHVFDLSAPVVEALSSLFDATIDRLLATSVRVTSAAEGRALLAGDDGTEAVADQLQRVVVLAVPVVRTLLRGARLTRVPWVLVATTAFSIGSAVRSGLHEIRVLCSFVASRLEQETGGPADPAVVKRVALGLYVDPRNEPSLSEQALPLGRILRGWLVKGAIGRDTRKRATKALDAVERLDLHPYVTRSTDAP